MPIATAIWPEAPDEAARRKVFAALDVLHQYAPKQLARVPCYMMGIIVFPIDTALGRWVSKLDICLLDEKYTLDDETVPELLACTIVHELTHARLGRAGPRYSEPHRARCERICFLAERNFIARLPESSLRQQLYDRIDSYLAMPSDYWSDDAVARRQAEERQRWPWWQKMLHTIADLVRKLRRGSAT